MASIVIKDLTENVELDRKAMVAISGGARTPGRQAALEHRAFRNTRVFEYPSGFTRNPNTGKRMAVK